MATNTGTIDAVRTTEIPNFDDESLDSGANGLKAAFGEYGSKVNDVVSKGISTLKDQYQVVNEKGVQGVRDDVVDYAKREPLKALLLAGGIGALAALIIRRR